MRKIILSVLFVSFAISMTKAGNANNNNKDKSYSKFPYWIAMMSDEKANYFEALKAFDLFWEHRQKPMQENEILGEGNEKYINDEKALAKRLKKLPAESRNLAFQYKKFLHWSMEVKPYVQEDGSILTKTERLNIYYQNK